MMILLPFVFVFVIIYGFHSSIDLIVHTFPSTYDLFCDNYIAYAIFALSVFVGCPWLICIPVALIAGVFFADLWYAPLIQFIALEFAFYLFSAIVTFILGSTFIASSSIYEKLKNKFADSEKGHESYEDIIEITSNTTFRKVINNFKSLFSFTGRIGRKTFMVRTFILWIGFVLWAFVLLTKIKVIIALDMIFFAFLLFFQMSSIIRRLHDMNQSGWWCLGIIIMQGIISHQNNGIGLIVSLVITAIFAFVKGSEGVNSYGGKS